MSTSDITAMCFDDRQRKWIIGNQAGQIQVFNGMNGALMKEGVSHKSEVTAVFYDVADKCIISTSWDRRVRVHDEEPAEKVKELRVVENAHNADVGCLAHSFEASLVATACSNLVIRVWDFQNVRGIAQVVAVVCEMLMRTRVHSSDDFGWRAPWPRERNIGNGVHARPRMLAVVRHGWRGEHVVGPWSDGALQQHFQLAVQCGPGTATTHELDGH